MAFARIGLSATLEFDHQYASLAQILREANRHVVNVLTALRSYVDQAPQLFKALDLQPDFASTVKKCCRRSNTDPPRRSKTVSV